VNLLALTCRALEIHGVLYAGIGATALAVHGVTRATADLDLLATDPRCLDPDVWSSLVATGIAVDVRLLRVSARAADGRGALTAFRHHP